MNSIQSKILQYSTTLFTTVLIFISFSVLSQTPLPATIHGPTSVGMGTVQVYTYDPGVAMQNPRWIYSGGTVTPSVSGTVYTATVTCNSSGTLTLQDINGTVATLNISVSSCTGMVAPISIDGSRCGPGPVLLSVDMSGGYYIPRWYSSISSKTPLLVGDDQYYTTPSISTTTSYYVSRYVPSTGCESSRVLVTANILSPTANGGPDQTGASTCGLTSVTLAATGTGTWSVISGTGGSFANASSATSAFNGLTGSSYVLRWAQTSGACPGTDDVNITFNTKPTAAATNQIICAGGTANLVITNPNAVTGTVFSWVPTFANAEVVPTTTSPGNTIAGSYKNTDRVNMGIVTYSITPASALCTGNPITASVTINNTSSVPSPGFLLAYGTSAALYQVSVPTGLQALWYSSLAAPTPFNTTPSYQSTSQGPVDPTYFVSFKDPTTLCETPRVSVGVTRLLAASPSNIKKEVVRVSGQMADINVSQLNSATQKAVTISYIDGLARVCQQVDVKATPQQQDVISPIEYDAFGNSSKSYLPYAKNNITGYQVSYPADQAAFYTATNDKIANDNAAFASAVYEASPLGRQLEQANAGQAWQAHTSKINYSYNAIANSSDEVWIMKTDPLRIGNGTINVYADNKLTRLEKTNEDGNKEVVFLDGAGNTIAIKKQLGETINSVMVDYLSTYYVYDDLNNLRFIVPPSGFVAWKANNWTMTTALQDQYLYQFVYDERGRLTQKKTPGQAWLYYGYDIMNRLVLVQDGNMRPLNKWMYIKYDRQGRAVMTGLYTNTSQPDLASIQTLLNNQYASGTWFETRTATTYTNVSFPITNADAGSTPLEIQNFNFYDTYDFDDADLTDDFGYVNQNLPGESLQSQGRAFGMPTGSKKIVLGSSPAVWLYTYMFYDTYGRAIQLRSNNHLSPTIDNLATSVYDFEGKVLTSQSYHKAGAGRETTTISKYQYDLRGRRVGVTQSTSQPISQYTSQAVRWVNQVNVDGDASILGKVNGNTAYWDAGASSSQSIPAGTNGYLEFTAGETNTDKMVGLSAADNGTDYNTINYAIYAGRDGNIYIYEDGVKKGGSYGGLYTTTDVYRIERSGTSLLYKKNGTVLRTVTGAFTGALYGDCTFMQLGGSIKNSTMFGQLNSLVNLTANGNTLTKTSGTNGAWDAGTFSNQSIPANTNGWVEFVAGETTTDKVMGLSPLDNGAGNTIKFGLNAAADGNLYTMENGTKGALLMPYSSSSLLRVERAGSAVVYKCNGSIIATSSVSSTTPLYADCSFATLNGSLKNVSVGVGDVQLVRYEYNELGQLVDKKLHSTDGGTTFLQSVDYRYGIQGSLSSINNAQLTSDALLNDETNDYFGMELLYEQTEAGLTTPADVYYNGKVSAIKWKGAGITSGATDQRSYKFAYDKTDKLKTATAQVYSGSAWTNEAGILNESLTYDHNGNIQTLQRNQRKYGGLVSQVPVFVNETIDNLTYSYNTSIGDQLLKVTDAAAAASAAVGFNNGTSGTSNDYTYDNNGNLTKDLNKNISNIVYNHLGKPLSIMFTDNHHVDYVYDAAGTKLTMKKYNTNNALENTTDYVNSFVYENNVLSLFGSPEGRVANVNGTLEYQYAIADHQGNTRVVFSSQTPAPLATAATFEYDANDNTVQYENVNRANVVPFVAANHSAAGSYVIQMNQSYKTGPSKSLSVFPGDKVDMEVWEYHEGTSGFGTTTSPVATFITNIATAIGGASGVPGELGLKYTGVSNALAAFGHGGNLGDARPAAYLNYILFDKNYNVLNAGYQPAPAATFTKQKISFNTVTIKEPGYLYVYLSYEDDSNNYVYFDDFKVTHTKTNVLQYNEYYPFGLQANTSWTRDNSKNNFLHNEGSELNVTTGWYDLPFRNYDPTVGRFFQVDPLAHRDHSTSPFAYARNSPIMLNDPSGLEAPTPPAGWSDTQARSLYWSHSTTMSGGYDQWAVDGFGGIYGGIYALNGAATGFSSDGNGNRSSTNSNNGMGYNKNGQYGRFEKYSSGDWACYNGGSYLPEIGTGERFVDALTPTGANIILNFSEKSYTLRDNSGWKLKSVSSMEEATEYLHSLKLSGKAIKNVVLIGHGNYEHISLGTKIVSDLNGNIKTPESLNKFNEMLAEISPGGSLLIIGCMAGGPFGSALQNNIRCDINVYMNSNYSSLQRYISDKGIAFGMDIGVQDGAFRNITQDPNGNSPYRNISLNSNGTFNLMK